MRLAARQLRLPCGGGDLRGRQRSFNPLLARLSQLSHWPRSEVLGLGELQIVQTILYLRIS